MGRERTWGWGGRSGEVGTGDCGVCSGWMNPQAPALSPARTSPQYRTSPHCRPPGRPRSQPQLLLAMSSSPSSPFYLLSTFPAQEGGEEPGWSRDCAPATAAWLRGHNKAGTVPSVPRSFGVLPQQPSLSCVGAKQCLVLGWRRGCQARPLETPSQAQEGQQHCQGHRLHQRVAGPWDDIEWCHPCTGSPGSLHTASVALQPKRQVPALHPWAARTPCHPRGRAGLAHGAMAAPRPCLAPQQAPGCPVPCLLPSPTPGGLQWREEPVLPWEIRVLVDSTPQPNKRSLPLRLHTDISANI